jgi:hypothetical protein
MLYWVSTAAGQYSNRLGFLMWSLHKEKGVLLRGAPNPHLIQSRYGDLTNSRAG